jgi:WD40 repeat protein
MKFPKFELTRVRADGTREAPKIVPVSKLPADMKTSRRGFFGAAMLAGAAALAGCAAPPPPRARARNGNTTPAAPAAAPAVGSLCGKKRAHKGKINALAFSPDGKFLLSSGDDNTVKLWAVAERAHLKTIFTAKGRNNLALAFDAVGKTFFIGDKFSVEQFPFPDGGRAQKVSRAPGGQDKILFGFAAGDGEKNTLFQDAAEDLKNASSISVSADEKLLAATVKTSLKLWRFADGGKNEIFRRENASLAALSPDGKLLVFSDGKNTLTLHALSERETRRKDGADIVISLRRPRVEFLKDIKQDTAPAGALAISPDGKILAVGASNGALVFWSVPDGAHLGCLMDLAASPDTIKGLTFSATSESGQIFTYTLPCGSPIPAGAVCTCNCVPGSVGTRTCTCNTVPVCSCNRVCTCQSVGTGRWICTCQAVRCR